MRFYKNIVGIIMVMLMTISLCINNVPADDSAASDKGGSVTSDNSGDAGDTVPVFEPKIMVESYNFSKKTKKADPFVSPYLITMLGHLLQQ